MELIAAVLCGFLSGLGIGGGSLLIVYLTAVAALPQAVAQGINLLYFLPTSAAALTLHSKNRFVRWRLVVFAIAGGVLFAAASAYLSRLIPTELLRKIFGAFLLLVGLNELRTGTRPKAN
ncbi:MAG: sulfite exporter TauE/SafE family protein [Oscillospiraceae bacterium]|nr:sulfite exporter TauE/SafE family protein [Oscillospiraceae bacterium]